MSDQISKNTADRELLRSFQSEINTHIPAVVTNFNENNTVNVIISIQRTAILENGETSNEQTAELQDVPVCHHRTGRYSQTSPIESGDRCMLAFCHADIDDWFDDGESKPASSTRRHDLSDAIAIFGLYPDNSVLPEWDSEWSMLRSEDKETFVAISDKRGVWLKDKASHLRLARNGFNVWVGQFDLMSSLIDWLGDFADALKVQQQVYGKMKVEPQLKYKGTYANAEKEIAFLRGSAGKLKSSLRGIRGSVEHD